MSVSTPARPHCERQTDAAVSRGLQVERWDVRRDGPVTERALEDKISALGYRLLPLCDPQGAIVSARVHPLDRAVAVRLSKYDLAFVTDEHDGTRQFFIFYVLLDESIDLVEFGRVHPDGLRRRDRQPLGKS